MHIFLHIKQKINNTLITKQLNKQYYNPDYYKTNL